MRKQHSARKSPAKKTSAAKGSKAAKTGKPAVAEKLKPAKAVATKAGKAKAPATTQKPSTKKPDKTVAPGKQKQKNTKGTAKPAPKKSASLKVTGKKLPLAKKPSATPFAPKNNAAANKPASRSNNMQNNVQTKPVKEKPTRASATGKKSIAPQKTKVEEIIDPPANTPDEEYMNAEQCEHFRHILLDWKKQLLEEMERTVHHMQDDAASFADPNDRATQEEEFSLELRARDRERKLIKKIEEALQRLDHNEYGYCEACGVEIGVQRLEARPTATLCIDCKTIDEIREKHYS